MTPQEFIDRWQHNSNTERSAAQSHFIDLCKLLGVAAPNDDPNQNGNYCFERGARRTGSGHGWADVWKRNHFGWEYKKPNSSLDNALKQLMTYALALDNPPLLVVSDRLHIHIHTHFTGTPSEVHTIALQDIGTPDNLQKLRWLFTSPDQFKPKRTTIGLTKEAAKLFGDLAWAIQQRGHDPQQVAHFLNKILFCLFAEDAAAPGQEPLLPNELFSKVLQNGLKDVSRFEKQLQRLFSAMSTRNGEFGEHLIEWFNGGLFDDDLILPLQQDDIRQLVNVAKLDWSQIEPSIFGTLFERGLDPAKRSQLGAHYTDPQSILRIVNPVIVEPLLAQWAEVKARIAAHMETVHALEASKKASDKAKATTAFKEANRLYIEFLESLKLFRVLDPACGSGNFLYMALQSLKDIELRVILDAEALGLERTLPQVGPEALYGIEINPYAAELARVTIWIGEIQWMLKHGFNASRNPILKTLNQIECRDALIDAHGAEAVWPAVDAIIGNPPFLGDKNLRGELGDAYVEALRKTYKGRVPGGADLVCYWFEKAHAEMLDEQVQRAGLVATNSIRGGANRQVLDRIVESLSIFNAWGDEPWINEGAAVRVSLINFARPHLVVIPAQAGIHVDFDGLKMDSRLRGNDGVVLDGKATARINADLTSSEGATLDLTLALDLRENSNACFIGVSKKGAFDVEGEVARAWLLQPNPNLRSNADVLRPTINGMDVVRRYSDTWIIDFNGLSENLASQYESPYRHVEQFVKPARAVVRNLSEKRDWWLIARNAPPMRHALVGIHRFIATSVVSKYRIWLWFDSRVLPEHAAAIVARSDDATFGILHSRFHEIWSLRMGTSLEDRPRYTPTTCFETFPFPAGLTPNLKPADYANPHAAAIASAAQNLDSLRRNWLNPPEWVDVVPEVAAGFPDRIIPKPDYAKAIQERTLTKLYNKRVAGEAAWLDNAHRALDIAVAQAYGWADYTPAMPDEEILRRLLALNLGRAHA